VPRRSVRPSRQAGGHWFAESSVRLRPTIPAGQASREVWRGKRRQLATRDPHGRHRWAIERTNAWLKAKRRIATRRDVKDDNYLAFLRLGMIHVLATSF